jgi:hypothetical protein
MADIMVHSSGPNGFTPVVYPTGGGTVKQGDNVTFQASGGSAITFYAQNGLFYLSNCSGTKNNGNTQFSAPAAPSTLTLCVAANPSVTTGYTLSLQSISDEESDPGDGTINVGTKPMEDAVTDPHARPRPQHAPGPAMQARGSD